MEFGFLLKKFISVIILPLSVVNIFFLIGIFLLYINRYKKSKIILTITFLGLFLISYEPFSAILIKNLESKYQKVDIVNKDIKEIVNIVFAFL